MRTSVFDRILENLESVSALGEFLNLFQGSVQDAFGGRLLAVIHQDVLELGDHDFSELWIRKNLTLFCATTTCHFLFPLLRTLRAVQ